MFTRKLALALGLATVLTIPLIASASAKVMIADESDVSALVTAVDQTADSQGIDESHGARVSFVAKNWDSLSANLTEGMNHGQVVSAYASAKNKGAKDTDEETNSDAKGNANAGKSDEAKGKANQDRVRGKSQANKGNDEEDTTGSAALVAASSTPAPTLATSTPVPTQVTSTPVPTSTATPTTTAVPTAAETVTAVPTVTETATPTPPHGQGNGNSGGHDRQP